MADNKPLDPEEQTAEKHVVEIMGPADSLDGHKPEQVDEVNPEQSASVATAPEVATTEPATTPPLPEGVPTLTEIEQDKQIAVEPDLDLSTNPENSVENNSLDSSEDKGVDTAVDDIMRGEADAALPDVEPPEAPVVMKESGLARFKDAVHNWWDNPRKRYATLVAIAVVLGVIFGVPAIRAQALNIIGVRSSVIVTAFDKTTNLPLERVQVNAGKAHAKTDANGTVRLSGVRLGKQDVVVAKAGFASVTKHINLGLRVMDLGNVSMKAIGTQYTLQLNDFLSGKPVADVAVSSGEATSKSDKTGKAILTVPPSDGTVDITVAGTSYRKESVKAPNNPSDVISVKLVPAAKDIFVNKASGKYDIYKTYADGKNKEVLLAGTGLETPNISLSVDEASQSVAVVSSRDDKRNSDGYLLSTLSIVNIADGSNQTVDHSEQFVLLGWDKNALIYQQTTAGVSAANPSRQKIFSYDVDSGKRYQLASANYFGGALLIGGKLYYVVSGTDPSTQGNFAMVNLDGSGRRTILAGTIWSFMRTGYDKVRLQKSDNTWYEYSLGDTATKASVAPSTYTSRTYVDSADGKTALWVDIRDTSGVIFKHTISDGTEKQLFTQKYAQNIVRWLSPTTFVVRVSSPSETADYAASVDGGQTKLITEVSPVQGF